MADEVDYALLGVSRQIGRALSLIAEALQILLEKRTTLEEKMIRSYFLELLPVQNSIAGCLIGKLAKSPESAKETAHAIGIESEVILELTTLNDAIIEAVESFLKAARYDLNYLEQYFEHNFYAELQNSQWRERISELAAKISTI